MDSFEKFLEKKNQPEKAVNWDERKNSWVKSVNSLYADINTWLNPFINRSLISVRTKDISIYEQFIGSYDLKQLDIVVGKDIISLIPRGTLILGSNGRIDMKGPKGDLFIIEPEWNKWKFVIKTNNKRELSEVNATSFQSAIQSIANG